MIRQTLCTRAILPLADPQRYAGLARRLRVLRRGEKSSLAENQARQWAALARLLQHADQTSDFYRQRFRESGFEVQNLREPADLRRIPPLTRADLREHGSEICSRQYDREDLLPAASGGTTDIPIRTWRDREGLKWKCAVQTVLNEWAGLRLGDRTLMLWGARSDYATNPSWRWRLYDHHLMGHTWAPVSQIDERVMEEWRQILNRQRHEVVYAYPTPLALFCRFLLDCGRPYWRPRTAICTAEALLPEHRQIINQALGCPVFEHYGSREFAMIGGECELHQGMHLHPYAAYVEMVDTGSGLAELLVTDLLNYGMPLIRYRINDCVVSGVQYDACPCGRGYARLPPVIGRTSDVFHLPDGSLVPGVTLVNRVIQVSPGLRKIQVIQEKLAEFRLRYVAGAEFRASDLEPLHNKLREFFPGEIHWEFESVAEIEREASGKTRLCISRVHTGGNGRPQ